MTKRILAVEVTGKLEPRNGWIGVDKAEVFTNPDDTVRPLHVSEVKSTDVLVFLKFAFGIRERGQFVREVVPYYVTDAADTGGILVAATLVEDDPARWASEHLIRLVRQVNPGELAQMNLTNLSAYAILKSAQS